MEAYITGLEASPGGATSRRWPAWRRSSSAGSTPRSTGDSMRSAPPRRWRCGARRRWPRASWRTGSSARRSPGRGGSRSRARGAHVQRPLWASTSTKNPAYPDTLYVDNLIGPDTVNTLPDATIEAFADHGTLARTVDAGMDEADATWAALPRSASTWTTSAAHAGARGRGVVRQELRRAAHGPRRQGHRAQGHLNPAPERNGPRPPTTPPSAQPVQLWARGRPFEHTLCSKGQPVGPGSAGPARGRSPTEHGPSDGSGQHDVRPSCRP